MRKFNDLSFSTSWNWRNAWHKNYTGRDVLEEIIGLGFNKAELNYKITKEILKSMYPIIESGEVEVTSLHNVFPYTQDQRLDTDSIFFAYDDEELRSKAVHATINTIDHAHQLGAKAVVTHIATTPRELMVYDRQLKELYRQGKRKSEDYHVLFKEMVLTRDKTMNQNMKSIIYCMELLLNHIEKKNYKIILGIENRAMCYQIPSYNEAKYIIDHLNSDRLGFWLDTGHSVMMENLGLHNRDELYQLQDKIVGVHIHDAIGVNDHFAPYMKSDCIDEFLPIIKNVELKVLELGCKNSKEDIIKGTSILYDKLMR
ncbi:sugar phosphate isomerase/epimerase family protein [Vallitalea okinawensis]|uniref:sugar phosphate isomerase/epimerase family protein n=1 Tax=Vallitalea okinawensis TaxID=2078660 RepID=UPI0013004503|nr:TIM barrel protein [Vallitalea okinawensis]